MFLEKLRNNHLLSFLDSYYEGEDEQICGKPKTHCQDGCRSLSGGVPKNLTLHWMKKIFFSFYHHKRQIRSFPTMYNT